MGIVTFITEETKEALSESPLSDLAELRNAFNLITSTELLVESAVNFRIAVEDFHEIHSGSELTFPSRFSFDIVRSVLKHAKKLKNYLPESVETYFDNMSFSFQDGHDESEFDDPEEAFREYLHAVMLMNYYEVWLPAIKPILNNVSWLDEEWKRSTGESLF